MIARRFHAGTAAVRRLDSIADTVFWIGAAWAAWSLHTEAIRPWLPWIAVNLGLEIARYVFDAAKFRREAAWHAWSAKAWGLSLVAAAVALFGFSAAWPFLPLAVGLGILADLEGLAISAILPRWTHDVPSVVHAVRIRRCMLTARGRT